MADFPRTALRSYGERVGVSGFIRECGGRECAESPPHPEFKLRLNSDLSPRAGRGGPHPLPLLAQA